MLQSMVCLVWSSKLLNHVIPALPSTVSQLAHTHYKIYLHLIRVFPYSYSDWYSYSKTNWICGSFYVLYMCWACIYVYRVGRWRTACVCICMERLFAYLIHLCNSAPTLFTLSSGVYISIRRCIYLCGHIVCCRRNYTVAMQLKLTLSICIFCMHARIWIILYLYFINISRYRFSFSFVHKLLFTWINLSCAIRIPTIYIRV